MKKLIIINEQSIIKTLAMILLLGLVPAAVFAIDVTPAAQPAVTAVAGAAPAVSGKTMTFDDCYNLAAEKNRDYRIAQLDKTIAEAQLSKAVASFGPSMTLMGGYEPILKSMGMILPANSFGMGFPPNDVVIGSPAYYYSARVSVSQPLFTFGKLIFGYKIAEESYKISQIKFKQAGEKLKLDVISAFYGALISSEMSKTMQETLKSKEEYLRITKTKYKNGQASNFDVLQAQVQYANTVPEAQKASDGAKLAMQMMKNTLGLPLGEEIVLSGSPEYKKMEMAYGDIKKKFEENNDDREMIKSVTNISGYASNLQAASLLPNIALSLNYTYVSADRIFHPEKEFWASGWDGTIGLQWTFYDGFKNVAALKEAMAGAEKAQVNEENVNNMLEIQLDQLYTSLEQSAKVIEAAGDLIKVAEEGYRIAKESYKNGLIQSVDLLNAETGLMQAKMNYLSAMLNYTTTVEKLKNFID
jgi:outer membrane protein